MRLYPCRYARGMIARDVAQSVLDDVSSAPQHGAGLRSFAMDRLFQLPGYDWCGVYRLEGDTLVLDEFDGEPTEHTRISVGVGVCGTAIAEDRNVVVDDVRNVDNYLACSVHTRSEIVVLIRGANAKVLGQIDIDGHAPGAFDKSDEQMLERLAEILAERWE